MKPEKKIERKIMFERGLNCVWIDLDNVLADFNKSARLLFGMESEEYEEKYGTKEFWKKLNQDKEFYLNLDMMPDADELYNAVQHFHPIILTGIPANMDRCSNQKTRWVRYKFGQNQRVICCFAREKSTFCIPGDILIDDRPKFKESWEEAGGTFITHTSAAKSISDLKYLGVIW